jgi:hypothetical protein
MPRFLNKGILFVILAFAFIWLAAVFSEMNYSSYSFAAGVSAVLMLFITLVHYLDGGEQ